MLRIQLVIFSHLEFLCTFCILLGTTLISVHGVSIDKLTNCQVCYLVVAVIFCMPVNTDSITQWAVMSGLVSVGDSCSLSLCCDLYKGGKLSNGKMYKCIINIDDRNVSVCLHAVECMRGVASISVTPNSAQLLLSNYGFCNAFMISTCTISTEHLIFTSTMSMLF